MSAKLPPRVFEFFHQLFISFMRQFKFPISHLKLVSMACFIIACKVKVISSSRERTFTWKTQSKPVERTPPPKVCNLSRNSSYFRLSAIFITLTKRLECANSFLPSDIFGSLMFLVNDSGMTFHNKIVDLIYKLIFCGLKTLSFEHVSYFALVFASQMLVLEYYNEHSMLQKMLDFFLHKFLVFHVISSLNLDFESLFSSREVSEKENFFQGNSSQSKSNRSPKIAFELQNNVNLDVVLTKITLEIVTLINQISFCRTKVVDELIKVKVVDRAQERNPPNKQELKKRFFKIEELRDRKLLKLLGLIKEKTQIDAKLQVYNDQKTIQNFLVGRIISFQFISPKQLFSN